MASKPESGDEWMGRQTEALRGQVTALQGGEEGREDLSAPRAHRPPTEERDQHLLQQIIQTSPIGILAADPHGRIIFCNRRAEQILGVTRDVATQRTCGAPEWKITGLTGEIFPEEDLPCRRVLGTGKPVEGIRLAMEKPDGHRLVLSVNAAPLLDASGGVAGVVESLEDITDRVRVWATMSEQNAFREAVIECAADGLCVCHEIPDSPYLCFSVWNNRMVDITGYSVEEINRSGWYQTVYPDPSVRQRAIERMARMRIGDNLVAERWQITRKDGSERPVAISTSVIQGYGQEAHVLALMRDLTEHEQAEQRRRHLEAQVQHVQKLESLGVLAGGIAHDFNNLLTGILGNTNLAQCEIPASSAARTYLRDIDTAARRAAELCRQLLAYAGKGRFIVELVDLNQIVGEMSRMMQVAVSKKAILKYNLAPSLPAVEGDATQIRQVVMNLMTNASEAIGERSGVVSIATGAMHCDRAYLSATYMDESLPVGDYVYVEVADTGCGMDAEVKARLFDPFFTTKFAGRGLGMAAVLGIMRGHRGAIELRSEMREGTTVKALFPAATERSSQPLGQEPTATSDWQGSGTVMVVDDEETVRTIAARMLRRMGFDTLSAKDGREAVELYRQRHADVVCVLLDLTMPHTDGEEVFWELRRINPQVRVVIASGYSEQAVSRRFVGKGIRGFIQKPFDLEALAKVLRGALQGP